MKCAMCNAELTHNDYFEYEMRFGHRYYRMVRVWKCPKHGEVSREYGAWRLKA